MKRDLTQDQFEYRAKKAGWHPTGVFAGIYWRHERHPDTHIPTIFDGKTGRTMGRMTLIKFANALKRMDIEAAKRLEASK